METLKNERFSNETGMVDLRFERNEFPNLGRHIVSDKHFKWGFKIEI